MTNSMTLTFSQVNPPLNVDLSQYSSHQLVHAETLSFTEKVQNLALAILDNLGFFFVALSTASYSTLSNACTSFKLVVLGYYGSIWSFRPPSDIYLVAFKVVFWVLGMAWCTATTTARLIYEHNRNHSTDQALLSRFASNEINVSHIKTNELIIDDHEVPTEFNMDRLIELFDQIEFNNPEAINYMAPGSRQEHDTVYDVERLRESLRKFINNVNGRVAFLGTPPAYDVPRLTAFYDQIEKAIRCSMFKAHQECEVAKRNYEECIAQNAGQIPPQNSDIRIKYRNSLENQARIAINLAIAGEHCGARYMGEAMELYDSFNQETAIGEGSLQKALIEILASKRKEIAREEIQIRLGSDTHHYNNYMSSLGHLLGIPGTQNVIEHLSSSLDRPELLNQFFKKYTVDCIIATVNQKMTSSQNFREKIVDWVRDNAVGWNSESDEQGLDQLLENLNPLLSNNQLDTNSSDYKNFSILQRLISYSKEQHITFPSQSDEEQLLPEDEVVIEFLAKPEVREWLNQNLVGSILEKQRSKQEIIRLFKSEKLGNNLFQKVREALSENGNLELTDFSQRLLVLQNLPKLTAHLEPDTAIRVLQGEIPLREAILNRRAQLRTSELATMLIRPVQESRDAEGQPESPENEVVNYGLSPQLMEWILVSHKILNVQES